MQCVLSGKAQEVYFSLSSDQSSDFEAVKTAILRSYELVPEVYRQKSFQKTEEQTYVEFALEKASLFDRWCVSQGVTNFAQLRDLIVLEEFKNYLPDAVTTFLNEQKLISVDKASVLADEFVLTHKCVFVPKSSVHLDKLACNEVNPFSQVKKLVDKSREFETQKPVCFYCRKQGHIMADCFVLQKKNGRSKPAAFVNTLLDS